MKVIALGFVVLAAAVFAPPTEACTCTGSRTFLDVVRDEPIAVVGRITAVGRRHWGGRESIDVAIDWVGKGAVDATTIRLWDDGAMSDCPGLGDLEVGQSLVIALRRVADSPPNREAWALLGFKPGAADYLALMQACAETHIVLRSNAQRAAWIGRRLG